MRIVIDMQGAQTGSRFRGIGRYTTSFVHGVLRNRGEHEVILVLSGLFPDSIDAIRQEFAGQLPQQNIRVWNAPGPVAENQHRNQTAELIREAFLASLQPDVIHISSLIEGHWDDAVTSIGCFDRHTPVSVSLYDLIPLLNPEQYLNPSPAYARHYYQKIAYLKRADHLLAISEFSREESLQHLGLAADAITSVSTAIDDFFQPLVIPEQEQARLKHKFALNGSFILYTGAADDRKNLPRLIQAYASLPAPIRHSHQLLFAGKMPPPIVDAYKDLAKQSGLRTGDLVFTDYISDTELLQLYNLCALYVFPSWHEGFGLPALEAMACGAPVIGSNTSSLPEVIGLPEAMFDPMSVESIAQKMQQALTDDEFIQRLKAHGLNRAKLFSWDTTARRAIAVWEQMARPEQTTANPDKPKLAFVSPLPPERSGIADYSAELLPALSTYYDIDIIAPQSTIGDNWISQHCRLRTVNWFKQNADSYQRVLYQMGNSSFHAHMLDLIQQIPGVMVLHDFYLSGLKAWLETRGKDPYVWRQASYLSHGYHAVKARYADEQAALQHYPANLEQLQHAQGVIVHSAYSKNLAATWYNSELADKIRVIPLLRIAPESQPAQAEAKAALGLAEHDFLLCSFGFLDSTKLNHRLLACWLASPLANNSNCHLVFVGENSPAEYGQELLQQIQQSPAAGRIRITGFASIELYRQYLAAADLGVQLRTGSRGETSAAVLDCMNYGLATIVNANGSIAELDPQAVCMLPDNFSDAELTGALISLWQNHQQRQQLGQAARRIIHQQHAPQHCAAHYAQAIEAFSQRSSSDTTALLRQIAAQPHLRHARQELMAIASAVAANQQLPQPLKSLYLDITATHSNDLKTGIERVARAITLTLLQNPPQGYRIEPVYLEQIAGNWAYRHARHYSLQLLDCPVDGFTDDLIEPDNGDLLLTLDLSGTSLIQAVKQGLHASYRHRGVKIYATVFDLLPVLMPQVFPPAADQAHASWLQAIAGFDGALCISSAVADELAHWRTQQQEPDTAAQPYHISWFHLGADLDGSAPSTGMPANADSILHQLQQAPTVLMVGTIEPRKGYLQALQAFDQLWQQGTQVNLVIVGREGWQGLPQDSRRDIPQTIDLLRKHPQLDRQLFWLNGISDEFLQRIYAASTCLLAASYGEGFGLPLIEAARQKLPILARDIPVFREVAGEHASYFNADQPAQLAQALQDWLHTAKTKTPPDCAQLTWQTWEQSATQMLERLQTT